MQSLKSENPILGELRGKIEILSICNLLCQICAAAPPAATAFLNHDVAVWEVLGIVWMVSILCISYATSSDLSTDLIVFYDW